MVMVTTFGLCVQQGLYLVPIAVLICGLWFSGLVVGLSSYLNQKVERMRRYQWIMHYVAGFVFLSYAIVMVCTL